MEQKIGEILYEIAEEYEMDKSIVDPFVQKLRKEFYIKLKNMKYMTWDKWKKFKLPENLFFRVIDRYLEFTPIEEMPLIQKYISKSVIVNPDDYIQESLDIDEKEIEKLLDQIEQKYIYPFDISNLYNNIIHCFVKIINYSNEEKYRKLNIKQMNEKFQFDLEPLFLSCHYTKNNYNNEFLNYNGNPNILWKVVEIVNSRLIEEKEDMDNSSINPNYLQTQKINSKNNKFVHVEPIEKFQSVILNPHQNKNEKQTRRNEVNNLQDINAQITKILYLERLKRQKIIESFQLQRNVKLFHVIDQRNLNKLPKEGTFHQYQKNEEERNEIQYSINYLEILKGIYNQNPTINDRITKVCNYIKSPIITGGDCFFIFPDNYIMRGTFNLSEPIEKLYSFVKDALANTQDIFCLFCNKEKVEKSQQKIENLKFEFPIIFNVVFMGNIYNKLKKYVVDNNNPIILS